MLPGVRERVKEARLRAALSRSIIRPMATQFLDFSLTPNKDARWHFDLCRKILRLVKQEAPSQRRFALWLRQNQIYDRAFLTFVLKLCDVKVAASVTIGEAGEDLLQAAAKSPSAPPVAEPPGAKKSGGAAPAPPKKDPFAEGLFDRFVELNGYLARFVFCEIADGFLATTEMTQRVGSAIYHGERPGAAALVAWATWMEWLGYLKFIGFKGAGRYKLAERGIDAWRYLKEMPEEELLEKGALASLAGIAEDEAAEQRADTRKFLTAEELGAGPNSEGPALLSGADEDAGGGGEDAEDEEEGGVDFGPEGAPLEAAEEKPAPEPKPGADGWIPLPETRAAPPLRRASAPPKPAPAEDESPISGEDEEAIKELFGEVHPAAKPRADKLSERNPLSKPGWKVEARPPEPAPAAAPPDASALADNAARAEARNEVAAKAAHERREPAREKVTLAPQHPEPAAGTGFRATEIDLLAAQWEHAPGRRPLSAREVGLVGGFSNGREGFALFALTAAAILLEADAAFAPKMAALRDLARARALESLFDENAPLEKVLETLGLLEGEREIGPVEERLLHLARLRRALRKKDVLEPLAREPADRRAAAIRELSGHALGAGAFWVEREMRRLGIW